MGKIRDLFTANDMTVGTPWKLLALFVGIATGAGILVAQFFGAKDRTSLEKTIGNCIFISFAAGLVIMIGGPLLTTPMLRAMNTLPEMFDACRDYLNIFFWGIFGFMFYNIFAGILRGLGDSFSALLFLIICAGLNVAGDLLLVGKMGVAGVALATVIAQMISAILCLIKLMGMTDVFTLSMLIVQALVNSFGDAMLVAANVMVMRVDGYAMLPNFSFGQAMGTYAGQNVGAGRLDRLKPGTRQGTAMTVLTALVLVPVIIWCGPALMDLFAPGNTELINLAMGMMYILAVGYIAVGVTQSLQGVIRGAGDTTSPMWITIFTTVFLRIPLAYGLVALMRSMGAPVLTQEKMIFVSLLSVWVMGAVITTVVYFHGGWRKKIPTFGGQEQ